MLSEIHHIPVMLRNFAGRIFQKYSIPRWMVFAMDIFAVFYVLLFAYLLRFNFVYEDIDISLAVRHAFLGVSIYALFSLIFRSYSGLLRHTTVTDMFTVFLTTTVSFLVLLCLSLLCRHFGSSAGFVIPISILIIHYFTISILLFLVRIFIKTTFMIISNSYSKKRRTLIYGTGVIGLTVTRVIECDMSGKYQIAGFIDENKSLHGKKLNNYCVYRPSILSESFVLKNKIETLIIADKELSPEKKVKMIHQSLDLGLEILEAPDTETWLNGKMYMNQIQKVKIIDLLEREPINLNLERIKNGLYGKTILVTGAAGSIGSEIVRQLTSFDVDKIILVDQAETPVFHLENELKSRNVTFPVHTILADVTNPEKMETIFSFFHPDIVFHAAAYKHVPLMEENPHEAIRVNIGGTKLLTRLAVKYNVGKFVMISTDKAVNPANVMGASKRLCEIIVQIRANQDNCKTEFVITRFGNVLGSNGSVIPLFTKQIEEGGPVTVTDPDITRYFMTIPEACQLVLEAGFMGKGGEIFVFDMGKQIKILDLAIKMIRLSGMIPDKDIKIVFTGLRPGEKLYEELLTNKENTCPTHHPKIKIARVEYFDSIEFLSAINEMLKNLYSFSKEDVIAFLRQMVPEFHYQGDYLQRKITVDEVEMNHAQI